MRKIKSQFIMYFDFENILVLGNNGKKNPNGSYMNKYQIQVGCNFVCKLACVNDQFSSLLIQI